MTRRVAILLAAAAALGATSNAFHPRGLSWSRPLGPELRARAVKAGLVPLGLDDVRRHLKEGKVLFVDARKPELFEIGALPGALSVPWKDVEEGRVPKLPPKDRPLVLYCDNEWCEYSLRLGTWLLERGYRDVAVFIDGYEAWWNADGAPR